MTATRPVIINVKENIILWLICIPFFSSLFFCVGFFGLSFVMKNPPFLILGRLFPNQMKKQLLTHCHNTTDKLVNCCENAEHICYLQQD